MLTRFALIFVVAAAVIFGWYRLFAFSATPGAQFAAPARLPSDFPQLARSQSDPSAPLLLVFIHPRCSCSRATLEQLDQILVSTHRAVRIALIVYHSSSADESPASISQLHHPAQIVLDPSGIVARRFGAATSGEIILYSDSGHLLFQGGITPMRSQTGPNPGADALRLALTIGTAQPRSTSVFGCSIFQTLHAG